MRIFVLLILAVVIAGTPGHAQGLIVLYSFQITDGDPECTLVEGSPGVFYGGASSALFKITPAGVFTDLFNFESGNGTLGTGPVVGVVEASDGYLYGPTFLGGNSGGGSVYRSDLAGNVKVLNTGVYQSSPLVEGLDGNLYGITNSPAGDFSFFRLTTDGVLTLLHDLGPNASTFFTLVLANDGNFYGVTPAGAASRVIYRLTPEGQYTVIHTFSGNEGGSSSLMQASNGLLYGGVIGAPGCPDGGTGSGIFAVSLSGDYYTGVHAFPTCDRGPVTAGLIETQDGNLYGPDSATISGETAIFRMSLDGSNYANVEPLCHVCGNDLDAAGSAFIQGSDGNFYGTSVSPNSGTVFEFVTGLTPPRPTVAIFQPKAGAAGTQVRIKGSHLVGLSGVSFNGAAATFVNRGNDYAIAVVPEGATSGPITVTTMNGSATSKASFDIQ